MILEAREKRHNYVLELYKKHQKPVVTLKTNVVGEEKNPSYMAFFLSEINKDIIDLFKPLHTEFHKSKDGNYYIYIIDQDIETLKKALIKIEETSYGRLLDLDITTNQSISRKDFKLPQRKCLICDEDAFVCIRKQTHTKEEILNKTVSIIKDFYKKRIFDVTYQAILDELDLYPKFGLVSNVNNGCHNDMTYETFLTSRDALQEGIAKYIEEGLKPQMNPKRYQEIGLEMEKDMFKATNGINTHKGLIFLLGIFLPAFTFELYHNTPLQKGMIRKVSLHIIKDYYYKVKDKSNKSNSDYIFLEYGIKGVRGEAMEGLPSLFNQPPYDNHYDTLLYYMSVLDDTTIIHKRDLNTLFDVKATTSEILSKGGYKENKDMYNQLCETYLNQGISPGGSADMLVISIIYNTLKLA